MISQLDTDDIKIPIRSRIQKLLGILRLVTSMISGISSMLVYQGYQKFKVILGYQGYQENKDIRYIKDIRSRNI